MILPYASDASFINPSIILPLLTSFMRPFCRITLISPSYDCRGPYDGRPERGRLRDGFHLRPARGETLRAVQAERGKDQAPCEQKKREDDKVPHLDPHGEKLGQRRRRILARHQHRGQPERQHHQHQVEDLGGFEQDAASESRHSLFTSYLLLNFIKNKGDISKGGHFPGLPLLF